MEEVNDTWTTLTTTGMSTTTPTTQGALLPTFPPGDASTPTVPPPGANLTSGSESGGGQELPHNLTMIVVMTVIYILITITGVLGNVATCIVIVRNRIMHTATNYYLFSMAVSDLLLLALGMPDEFYLLWWGEPYIFGSVFCFIRGFTAEISTNASILTIAAFTVERYIGICHPLRSHTMSQLGRVIRSIAIIWIVATVCAVPIAMQYGIVYQKTPDGQDIPNTSGCYLKKRIWVFFEVSTVLFFVAPMLLITVLYVCIAVQLKKSSRLARSVPSIGCHNCASTNDGSRNKAVIKMLVAVVIAFFVCFAPHQAQRLMALHADPTNPVAVQLFNVLFNISGVSYYISTCVNPILYHIMSNRFREALQATLESCYGGRGSSSGGRWRARSQSSRSQHTLELTEHSLITDSTTNLTTSTGASSDASRSDHKTHLKQALNGARKDAGKGKMASRKTRNGSYKFRPLFKPKLRRAEIVESPVDMTVSIAASPAGRKRSQSDSLLSGGSISNCSMKHVEEEFTRKELSEVMGRMNTMEV
ncbi:pyrokinin-1 receptor isoform X1 [Procambarus clarkii]|uniref:pyrokinin-1 receptor isoform X1 n=1 Tax=Procambarus clarkii TaxID=6728 RepID=UPI001E674203|nr:pyrokinin-1 receptor-like isoform X1 [Procambarus clarkii]